MDLRTYFTGQALAGISTLDNLDLPRVATEAVMLADLTIDALNGVDVMSKDVRNKEIAANIAANVKSINEE